MTTPTTDRSRTAVLADHNAALPAGYLPTADQVTVHVDGLPVRVVRYAHFDVPLYFVHASLPPGQEHEVAVTVKRYKNSWSLHPQRLGIAVTQDKKALRFKVRGDPHLVLECDALGYLAFAFDPAQPEPQGPGVVRADELGLRPEAAVVQTAAIQAALDRVSSDPSLHTLVLPPGVYRAGDLHLRSHCRLHLSSGAVLKASDHASDMGNPELLGWDRSRASFINARDAEDLAITGHGHLDGNRAVLDLEQYYIAMVRLKGCRHVRLDGPVFSDPCNWNTHLRACEDVVVHRLKVLNNRPMLVCINTDGVNPDCSRRVTIEHCLMHTGDDAVAVKSCDHGDGLVQDVADITVTDLLAINNSTTAKIGTETCAAVMERIRFERIDAVRTARLCAIDGFDAAHIRDVVFVDCHVHHLDHNRPDGVATDRLIDLHASAKTWRAVAGKSRISQVTLRNIRSDQQGRCVLTGRDAEYGVRGLDLRNIVVAGRTLEGSDLVRNAFVSGVLLDGHAVDLAGAEASRAAAGGAAGSTGVRFLSAYYFMGQDLCMVRRHTCNDMRWLADHAFDAVCVGVHEEQWRQPRGLNLVIEEAHAAGLQAIAIPSRWCGLIAGWPVLAGHFAASRPDVWMRQADGSPLIKNFCGPLCSVHHPDVQAHMVTCTERILKTWDLDGLMWDELKTLHETDHHPLALARFGGPASGAAQVAATLEVFAACNRTARALKPNLRICSFLYAYLPDDMIAPWAATEGFDDVGLDGKLGWADDFGMKPPWDKTLLQHASRFIAAAKANGRRSFALIETQDLNADEAQMTVRRLPALLALGIDHLSVYYHPLVREPSAQVTERIGPPLAAWRRRQGVEAVLEDQKGR